MKKRLFDFFALILLLSSCKTDRVCYDKYVGKMDNIINKFGQKYCFNSYVVNKQYHFSSEIEPDYFRYFSEEEKKNDVCIYEYKWKKGKKTIIVWGKDTDGELRAFSSVEFSENIMF